MRPSGHRGAVELVALEGGGGSGGRFDGEKWDCGCVNVSGNGKDVVVWIKYIRLNDKMCHDVGCADVIRSRSAGLAFNIFGLSIKLLSKMRCPSAPPAHAQQTMSTPPTRQSPTSASQYACVPASSASNIY